VVFKERVGGGKLPCSRRTLMSEDRNLLGSGQDYAGNIGQSIYRRYGGGSEKMNKRLESIRRSGAFEYTDLQWEACKLWLKREAKTF